MILITGDIHGDIGRFSHKRLRELKKGDTLIICGDLGFIWDGSDKEKKILKKLGKRRYNVLFVEGAHENFDELEKYETEEWCGGLTRRISGNLRQLIRGYIFDIDGKKIFAFGGGSGESNGGAAPCSETTASRYEMPSAEETAAADRRLGEIGGNVDYIVTYEPPVTIAEFLNEDISPTDTVGVYLEDLRGRVRFRAWFFGKHHLNKMIPPKFAALFDNVINAETMK